MFTSPGYDVYLFSVVGRSFQAALSLSFADVEPTVALARESDEHWDFETLDGSLMVVLTKGQRITVDYIGHMSFAIGNSWGGDFQFLAL